MSSEDKDLSRKTWARSVGQVTKVGYMDGASDGQQSVYQQSFDIGYEQGFNFGLQLGFQKAMSSNENVLDQILLDPRKINCHICINKSLNQENMVNLYNSQEERNGAILEIPK